jgi:hypothetical protein
MKSYYDYIISVNISPVTTAEISSSSIVVVVQPDSYCDPISNPIHI